MGGKGPACMQAEGTGNCRPVEGGAIDQGSKRARVKGAVCKQKARGLVDRWNGVRITRAVEK